MYVSEFARRLDGTDISQQRANGRELCPQARNLQDDMDILSTY